MDAQATGISKMEDARTKNQRLQLLERISKELLKLAKKAKNHKITDVIKLSGHSGSITVLSEDKHITQSLLISPSNGIILEESWKSRNTTGSNWFARLIFWNITESRPVNVEKDMLPELVKSHGVELHNIQGYSNQIDIVVAFRELVALAQEEELICPLTIVNSAENELSITTQYKLRYSRNGHQSYIDSPNIISPSLVQDLGIIFKHRVRCSKLYT